MDNQHPLKRTAFLWLCLTVLPLLGYAQRAGYWQQAASYKMNVHLDAAAHTMQGTQRLVYTNNSPDTLRRVFYHLYFNAFQPGSMMDVRSRTLPDPDSRIGDRIYHLNDDEIGYQHIQSLKQDGRPVSFSIQNTIMEVKLNKPILPGEQAVFDMKFDSQVPIQIRRSGRDNAEGIDYSMTQWYPKMAEYTADGWQTHPYVEREFIGVWGNFDVKITIDSSYTIGGTGYLQNPQQVGHGYEDPAQPLRRPGGGELTWHFYAPNVHDFAWAADPDYKHETYQVPDGPTVHLLYVPSEATKHWDILGKKTVQAIQFYNKHVGTYAYKQYSVVQGGDGGMEYPMCTLITGERSPRSLVGVMAHELAHNWFYGMLGSNESRFPWMDEGFTSHFSARAMKELFNSKGNPLLGSYMGYLYIKYLGLEEPSNTQADRFTTNMAYGISSYSKPAAFLDQLSYVVGKNNFDRAIHRYFDTWRFKHPTPEDFERVVEKESDMVLDWYFNFWWNSTDEIDYSISDVSQRGDSVDVNLKRLGNATMPLDVQVTYKDGSKELHNIPLGLMRNTKPAEEEYGKRYTHPDWAWTLPEYTMSFKPHGDIASIVIDPSNRLADVNRLNNRNHFPLQVHWLEPTRPDWNHYNVSARPALWYGIDAGLRLGFTSSGSYLFGDRAMDLDFFLTSGSLEDYRTTNTDADYRLSYTRKLDNWGLETYLRASARRYYGIFGESLELSKHLGQFGALESTDKTLSLKLFHQVKTADRQSDGLDNYWEPGSVYGAKLSFEFGDARTNGFSLNTVAAAHKSRLNASYAEWVSNRTLEWADRGTTRFGFNFGLAAGSLPTQYRFSMAGPTSEQLWENETFTSFYNMVGTQTANDIHLLAKGGNGLLGYGLSGIGSPDRFGNNYWSATIWNTYAPFKQAPFNLELFAGAGKSWNGRFFGDMPILGSNKDKSILASIGTGATYDLSALQTFSRWTAQSRFLQKLQLSLRMPFYMHSLNGHDDFKPRLVFGISETF